MKRRRKYLRVTDCPGTRTRRAESFEVGQAKVSVFLHDACEIGGKQALDDASQELRKFPKLQKREKQNKTAITYV